METILGQASIDLKSHTIATIGTFDGIHRGHQAVIQATVEAARKAGLPSVLLTFDVHPRQILRCHEPVEALTTLNDKLELLEQFDLDYVCVLNFKEISKLSAHEFYQQILVDKTRTSHLFVGTNFRFGAGATGDPQWLRDKSGEAMTITEFPLQKIGEEVISSTAIRNLLRNGEVDKVPLLLGRPLSLSGRVVRGAGRGAGLGFPTANVEFNATLCAPGMGVYVGYLHVARKRLPAVINCGTNPTFDGSSFSCEAHVLDYHQELYGQEVKLELSTRLRDEMKFPSPEALSRQISEDVSHARSWFSRAEELDSSL